MATATAKKRTTKKAVKKAVKAARKTIGYSAVYKPNGNFASVTQKGQNGSTRTIASSHPSFKMIVKLLQAHRPGKAFLLMDPAELIKSQSYGKITIDNGEVLYKGKVIHSALTTRILRMIDEGVSVTYMMKFMDNLYQNPSQESIANLYEFLERAKLPITDDGCFVAYKAVDIRVVNGKNTYLDCHTHTVDNAPGQVIMMPRASVDPNRNNECSYGYHVCSLGYLRSFSGNAVLEVKVNPADVVAVPKDYGYTKMRVWRYEVLRDLGSKQSVSRDGVTVAGVDKAGHPDLEDSALRTTSGDRQSIIKELLKNPTVKRNIRKGHIAETTIRKMTYGRLLKMVEPFREAAKIDAQEVATVSLSVLLTNPIAMAIKGAGVTRSQVARNMDISVKSLWAWEKKANPTTAQVDEVLLAIAQAQGSTNGLRNSGISVTPELVKKVTFGRAKGGFNSDSVAAA